MLKNDNAFPGRMRAFRPNPRKMVAIVAEAWRRRGEWERGVLVCLDLGILFGFSVYSGLC